MQQHRLRNTAHGTMCIVAAKRWNDEASTNVHAQTFMMPRASCAHHEHQVAGEQVSPLGAVRQADALAVSELPELRRRLQRGQAPHPACRPSVSELALGSGAG